MHACTHAGIAWRCAHACMGVHVQELPGDVHMRACMACMPMHGCVFAHTACIRAQPLCMRRHVTIAEEERDASAWADKGGPRLPA
eukprot:275731-Chlamydomonas_euryale.AAC.3